MSVVIETSIGDFTIDLFTKKRPKACFNFLKLCKIKYYYYCLIFEVKRNFAARTGDPENTGTSGESIYWFDKTKEVRKKYFSSEKVPQIKHDKPGLVSMVNNGQDKHGSQFFITLSKDVEHLDKQGHTVFGQIVEGLDIIKTLNTTLIDDKDCPYKDICISHTVILDDPFSDPPYVTKLTGRRSPDVPDYLVDSKRVGIYDDLNQDDGKTEEQLAAEREEKEIQEKAILLEMLGDLPNANAKPPENVLFICKLNPITEEEDLERIFSRFEYDHKDDCEKAYLKMDNVLLDDRRIHVDFSQSVSKRRKLLGK